jgi:hypothetical protein
MPLQEKGGRHAQATDPCSLQQAVRHARVQSGYPCLVDWCCCSSFRCSQSSSGSRAWVVW